MTAQTAWSIVAWHSGILLGIGVSQGDIAMMAAGSVVSVVAGISIHRFGGVNQ